MAKLWHGRFKKGTHPLLESFSESLSFDRELAHVDIRGSRAHATMLAKVKLITAADLKAILAGLKKVEKEITEGKFVYRQEDEDIHMAVEARLTALVGEPAKRLHTARSRNDQVATDLRLWTRKKLERLRQLLRETQKAMLKVARKNAALVIPGYTHLQRAQPVLLAQHLLAYVEMWERDGGRLADAGERLNWLPLGSCALAGTTLPIDRAMVAKALGFKGVCANSMDGVSDRDFVVETLSAIALLFVHLSRLSEDVILWASSEWQLIKLDDAWSTGSSIMPQKRNPDFLELTRGKSGRVFGDLTAMLTILKGLPMTYNRDLQEDKIALFDAVRTAEATLTCMKEFLPTLRFDAKRAAAMLDGGFLEATALAEYLVEKGLPFRECHAISGTLVRLCEDRGCRLADLTLTEMRQVCPRIGADVAARLEPGRVPASYRSAGSAGDREVGKNLARWQKLLG